MNAIRSAVLNGFMLSSIVVSPNPRIVQRFESVPCFSTTEKLQRYAGLSCSDAWGGVVELPLARVKAGINSVTLERTKDPRSRRKPLCTHSGPNTPTPKHRKSPRNPIPDTRYPIPPHPDTPTPRYLTTLIPRPQHNYHPVSGAPLLGAPNS